MDALSIIAPILPFVSNITPTCKGDADEFRYSNPGTGLPLASRTRLLSSPSCIVVAFHFQAKPHKSPEPWASLVISLVKTVLLLESRMLYHDLANLGSLDDNAEICRCRG